MTGAALRQANVRERSIWLLIGLAGMIVAALLWLVWSRPAPGQIRVTTLDQLPPESAAYFQLDATFHDPLSPPIQPPTGPLVQPLPVPLILLNDQGTIRAFYHRDPRSGCLFAWERRERLFIDPCHGSAYESDGYVPARPFGAIWISLA